MPTIRELSDLTGFSRDAITTRVKRWGLGADFDPKDIFELKPLDEAHKSKISLEEARTDLAIEETGLKRIQREKLEGKYADIDEVLEAQNELLEGVAAIVRGSSMDDDRKADVFTAIRDHGKEWGRNR